MELKLLRTTVLSETCRGVCSPGVFKGHPSWSSQILHQSISHTLTFRKLNPHFLLRDMWTVWPNKYKMQAPIIESSCFSGTVLQGGHFLPPDGNWSWEVSQSARSNQQCISRTRPKGASVSLSVTVLTIPWASTVTVKCHLVQLSLYSPTTPGHCCQEKHSNLPLTFVSYFFGARHWSQGLVQAKHILPLNYTYPECSNLFDSSSKIQKCIWGADRCSVYHSPALAVRVVQPFLGFLEH